MAEGRPLFAGQGGYQQLPQNPHGPPGPPPPPYDGPPKGQGPPHPGSYQGGSAPGPYQPQPPSGYVPGPGQQPTYMQPATTVLIQPQPSVVVVGGCPACRVGVLEDDFTCLGVCCAVIFFPIGVLCCLAMRQRRCPNCGAIFG